MSTPKKPNPTKSKKMPQRAPHNPNGGRPRKYKTPEEMQEIIDQYFNECYMQKHDRIKHTMKHEDGSTEEYYTWEPVTYPDGRPVMEYVQPVTITGLALALGMTRLQLIEYSERNEYTNTIKEAKEKVQRYVEWTMMSGGCHPSAAIFNLKNNYGWKDKTESEVTNTHMHLNGVIKASYQEADKLTNPTYKDLPGNDS